MLDMKRIRDWQIDQLRKMIAVLQYTVGAISQEDATRYRDGGDGWTVLEVMGHLNDVEVSFHERAVLTLNEDNPDLPFFDAATAAIENQYNEKDLQTQLDAWVEKRTAFVELLEGIADDQWSRAGVHPKRGVFSLDDQLFLAEWHDMNHLDQIVKIMRDKLTG